MKKENLFYVAILGFSTFFATAQINQTPVHSSGGQIVAMKEKSQAATGSMFITEKYMPARLSNNDKTILLRYNAYGDNFEMNDPQAQSLKILPKQDGVKITFTNTNESYIVEEYKTEKGELIHGYLNVISDKPNVKIFKRERVYLQPESFPANSYQTYKPANYKRVDDEFYIKLKDQNALFFSGKKELAKLVPAKSKEILDYIKQNKLDVEKAKDLEQIGTYMDSIL